MSTNLEDLWISRIRVDQIVVVLKPFLFGLILRSGHTRMLCKSIGPYVSTLHPRRALWSARALEDERKWDLFVIIIFVECANCVQGGFLNKCPWPILRFIPVSLLPLFCLCRGLNLVWLTNGYSVDRNKGFWVTAELSSKPSHHTGCSSPQLSSRRLDQQSTWSALLHLTDGHRRCVLIVSS